MGNYLQANQYQLDANGFCSPNFDGDEIDINQMIEDIEVAAIACGELDKYKRALFYANPEKYGLGGPDKLVLPAGSDQMFLHAVLGMLTEAGELGETLVTALDGWVESESDVFEFDHVNAMEEGGDSLWYTALLAKSTGYPLDEMMTRNIAKLTKRNIGKQFNAEGTNNRDLEGERAVLEA